MDLAAAREEYSRGGLAESDLAAGPMEMFERWYVEARAAGVREPNAMVVSTTDADGAPSARFVLLKSFDEGGFVFYTNQSSRKGRALAAEPRIALLFPWHDLERQVRVEGTAVPLERAEVAAYFAQRPRGSQLGAWASHQSAIVAGRDELDAAYQAAEARFAGQDVPVPAEWGGYRVVPQSVEFWQGRIGRMHDRLVYVQDEDSSDRDAWTRHRLAP
jgi:pyridoxamine 5'-phosphate oxidase